MQKIYSHMNMAMVHLVKNELEGRGIETTVRGEHLAQVAGGGAAAEAWHELWIVDDARLVEAAGVVQEIIDQDDADAVDEEPWTCPHCGEEVEGTFAVCWNCGQARPPAPAA